MISARSIRPIDAMIVGAIVVFSGYLNMHRPGKAKAPAADFAAKVDLSPLDRAAVHADGRLRSFASHAKTYMGYVTGPRTIEGHSNGFTYIDLMFRPERYADVDLIHVKNKLVREQILEALKTSVSLPEERGAAIRKSGLISRSLLTQPGVVALLQRLGQDLIRSAKAVDAIQSGLHVSDPRFLSENLRLLPPPTGEVDKPWLSMVDLASPSGAPADNIHAGLVRPKAIPGLNADTQRNLAETWAALRSAWLGEDAKGVNTQIARLSETLPAVAPQLYPSAGRLAMESWYFRTKSMTWVWLIYLLCVPPLLMSVIYKWDGARKIGLALFLIAFAAQTASLIIRWYISGRWPNSNMFEAVTTSAWFGGVLAIILEVLARRSPVRNIFALGSAVMSMAALMAAYFLPASLDSAINNKMAALNDVWLYIHTNMIIWSYAVIGLACVPALLLLRHRWCLAWDSGAIPKFRLALLPMALGVLNYTAYLLLMHVIDYHARGLSGGRLIAAVGAFSGAAMIVLLEALAARDRRCAGVSVERSASGGASAFLMHRGAAGFLEPEKPTATQIFDGATMVLVELAFIMLWTGIIMGAIWADHSWGRPWGWDPKEVFALNTFLIFLVLIHVRLKVRDKAFWTAVLAVVGFEVMMFNWIVVNFIISGLHSYA